MYTEDEAHEKWCQEKHGLPYGLDRCEGSECMAWRWSVQDGDPRKVGYCGLAGKP